MKLQVLQEDLAKSLSLASRFSSSKAQLPVLANVLLTTSKNSLKIIATNLEISATISIGAKVEEEGKITVPAKTFTDIVNNLNAGYVNLATNKENLNISSSNFKSTLTGMNPSEFPSIPQNKSDQAVLLPKDIFTDSLTQVLFATSTDETRPLLTGVLFLFKKDKLVMVSTDGFRLSQKSIKLPTSVEMSKMVLPKNVLFELTRVSPEEDVSLYYSQKDNQVIFGLPKIVFSSRVLEGEYPDFEKIIPKESNIKITADKEDLFRCVKLASVFARDSANIVKFRVDEGFVEIGAESSRSGNQISKLEAKTEGGKIEIAFNYRFLEDCLQSMSSDTVQIEFSTINAPGVFTDPDDKDYLHLIMPVRLQD